MSAQHTTHAAHGHGGHDDHHDDGPHSTLSGYMTGFILSIILTAIPFWLVMAKVIADRNTAVLVLGAFAVVQIVVHMVYFLHMNGKIEGGWTHAVHHLHRGVRGHRDCGHAVGHVPHEREHDARPSADRPRRAAGPCRWRRPPHGTLTRELAVAQAAALPRRPHSPLILAMLTAVGIALFLGFVALGAWQVQRLSWKLDLIERVDQRLKAPPQPLPPACAVA